MTSSGIRDVAAAVLEAMTEDQLAHQLRQSGNRIVRRAGRWWSIDPRHFCQPVHLMARLSADQATPPHPLCWAYRAVLEEGDAERANASTPIHLMADVATYDPADLSANRRYHLRRSQRLVEFVQLTTPDLLVAQGYDVFKSAQERTDNPYRRLDSRGAFVNAANRWFGSPDKVVLAGLVDGRLGAYIAGHAVGQTAYVDYVEIATEVLQTQISTGLHHEFIEVVRRSPGIREVVHAQHLPEDPALAVFKAGIGFPVVKVPTRVRILPPLRQLLRRQHPLKLYRLTGELGPLTVGAARG